MESLQEHLLIIYCMILLKKNQIGSIIYKKNITLQELIYKFLKN